MAFTDLKSSTSLQLDNTLVVFFPNDRHAWMVNIFVHMKSLENPVLREMLDTQSRNEKAAASASAIEERSRDFEEFSKGILLYGSDVKVEGSWNVETLQAPLLEISSLNENQVHFNRDVWTPGLDTIVADLEKKMGELEISVADIEWKLKGEELLYLLKVVYIVLSNRRHSERD